MPFLNKTLRPIQSFVRREGRMSPRQRRALDSLWSKYGIDLDGKEINWQQIFGRDAAHILEIGFGMGRSLLAMAKASPEQDFIGVEVYQTGVGSLLADLEEQAMTNLRIFSADVIEVLEQGIPDASLDRVQLFFPDPWPKKRHHKRRLVQAAFVEKIADKLRPGGILHIATDWQDYAEHMVKIMANSPCFKALAAERPAYRPLTKYEQRGQALGHGVWDLLFVKR